MVRRRRELPVFWFAGASAGGDAGRSGLPSALEEGDVFCGVLAVTIFPCPLARGLA